MELEIAGFMQRLFFNEENAIQNIFILIGAIWVFNKVINWCGKLSKPHWKNNRRKF